MQNKETLRIVRSFHKKGPQVRTAAENTMPHRNIREHRGTKHTDPTKLRDIPGISKKGSF
jgi:hypothetical protein